MLWSVLRQQVPPHWLLGTGSAELHLYFILLSRAAIPQYSNTLNMPIHPDPRGRQIPVINMPILKHPVLYVQIVQRLKQHIPLLPYISSPARSDDCKPHFLLSPFPLGMHYVTDVHEMVLPTGSNLHP